MRWIIIIVLAFLFTTEAWAGTFRDDFEDGNLSGWELYPVDKSPKYQVEKGEACIKTNSWIRNDGVSCYCVGTMAIGSSDWRNYTLELRVKTVESEPATGHAIVIGIRVEDIPSEPFSATIEYSGVYMEIVSDRIFGWIIVYKVIKIDPPIVHKEMINVDGELIPNTWKETHRMERVFEDGVRWSIAFDTWYNVKAIAKDEHFKLYFNDDLVTSFDDANIISGKVRLFAVNAHVHFDDVSITGENVPDIGPSGMVVSAKKKLATTWGNVKRTH